jgi:hypothetical protein
MNKDYSKVVAGLLIVLFVSVMICLASCFGIRLADQKAYSEIELAAQRIGSEEPNPYKGIASYISNSIHVGMSRIEVEQILETIAPVNILERGSLRELGLPEGPTACDKVALRIGTFTGKWLLIPCYDQDGGLIHMKFSDPDFPAIHVRGGL